MKALIGDTLGGFVFLGVMTLTHSIAAAIVASAAVTIGTIGWRLARREPVTALQWAILVLVVGLGSVSLITRDPLFAMLKPSFIQAGIGATLLQPGWLARYVRPERLPLIPPRALVVAGFFHPVALFAMAAANAWVALNTTPEVWAAFSAVAPPVVFTVLGCGLFVSLRALTRRRLRAAATAAA
jgi:intracellular septation protein